MYKMLCMSFAWHRNIHFIIGAHTCLLVMTLFNKRMFPAYLVAMNFTEQFLEKVSMTVLIARRNGERLACLCCSKTQ